MMIKNEGLFVINELTNQYASQIQSISHLFMLIHALLNLIFAGAVAKDAGNIYKLGQRTALVSAATWAFATLVGGIVTATIYWFIHHSTLTRPTRENAYERY